MHQCEYLESRIAPIRRVIVFDCSESVIVQRLGDRGRWDDIDVDNIKRRLLTFHEVTSKVIGIFEAAEKTAHVDAEQSVEDVGLQLEAAVEDILQHVPRRSNDG